MSTRAPLPVVHARTDAVAQLYQQHGVTSVRSVLVGCLASHMTGEEWEAAMRDVRALLGDAGEEAS